MTIRTRCSRPSHYGAARDPRRGSGSIISASIAGSTEAGKLIVFEVNASMLVHDDNAEFPYKDAYVRAIKAAFDAMLRKLAGLS